MGPEPVWDMEGGGVDPQSWLVSFPGQSCFPHSQQEEPKKTNPWGGRVHGHQSCGLEGGRWGQDKIRTSEVRCVSPSSDSAPPPPLEGVAFLSKWPPEDRPRNSRVSFYSCFGFSAK